MQWIRSLLFTLLFFANSLLHAAAILLTSLACGRRFADAQSRSWGRSNLWLLKLLCRLDYTVEGLENIPREGAHIAFWKHSSSWETLPVMFLFPPQSWVVKREIYWIPLVGWATALFRPIAINRGAGHVAVNQVIEQGRRRLAEGRWILYFPEGTRVRPGQTRRYGLSGALLASRTGAKLVPVAHNASDFWPKRALLKKPGTVRVVIGPPIGTLGRDPRALNEQAKAWMDQTMARISGPPGPAG